jgi:hypothetical protein
MLGWCLKVGDAWSRQVLLQLAMMCISRACRYSKIPFQPYIGLIELLPTLSF